MGHDASRNFMSPTPCPADRRHWWRRALTLLVLAAAACIASIPPARADTDFLDLRDRLEVERSTLRDGLSKYLRADDATAFPSDKPGEAFGKYLDLALRAVDARTRFPEVQALFAKYRGQLDPEDATARQAFGVLLGDYLQVRYGADITRELGTLVGFKTYNTVVDRNANNSEFRQCFDALSRLAVALGLQVQNYEYQTLAITLPAKAGSAAPLGAWAHVDVPRPIGHKWETPPWTLSDRNNRYYGAGVADDKGPLVIDLFALRVLRDAGLQLARPVVLLVSSGGEDLGADAAKDIARVTPRPALVLATDGAYPYGTRELGRMVARVSSSRGMKSRAGIRPGEYFAHKMTTNQGLNTIPGETRIWVMYQPPVDTTNPALVQVNKWRATLAEYQKGHSSSVYETYIQDDTLHFFVYGKPAQTFDPKDAVNSMYDAAGALQLLPMYKNSAYDVLKWIDAGLNHDTSGASVGLAFESDTMGGTVVNPVAFDRLGDEVTVLVDIRWPHGHDAAWIRTQLESSVKKFNSKNGTELEVAWEPEVLEPVESVPPRGVRAVLDEAYALASGEGGSLGAFAPSCARLLPAAIPFGPWRPHGVVTAHTRDEFVAHRELQDIGVATLTALAVLATATLPPAP